MDFDREVNIAVRNILQHVKSVVAKNLVNAARTGQITIDEGKVRGLSLLIDGSIDEGYSQASRELISVLGNHAKEHEALKKKK